MHDTEVIAAASLVWNIARNAAPAEVTNHVDAAMDISDSAALPRLATRDVSSGESAILSSVCVLKWYRTKFCFTIGTGYTLVLNGREYSFAAAERAPPEVYMTKGYIA